MATTHIGEEVFQHSPHLNRLFLLHKKPLFSWFSLFKTLQQEKIQTALFFYKPPTWVQRICHFLGISILLETESNSLLDCLQLIEKLGARCSGVHLELFFPPPKPSFSPIPLIGIHPFAQKAFHQWPEENFIELGQRLKDHFGCNLLIIGDLKNKKATLRIASNIEGAEALFNPLSLEERSAWIKKMSISIVHDLDFLHLSLALNTPTLALLGHTDLQPLGIQNTYFFYEATLLQTKPTCFPCLKAACPKPFCMRQLTVEEVFDRVLRMFYRADHKLKILI